MRSTAGSPPVLSIPARAAARVDMLFCYTSPGLLGVGFAGRAGAWDNHEVTIPAFAIIGGGVRGTAALGRVAARLRSLTPARADRLAESGFTVHVVDPYDPGSGRIWRTGQPRSLVMNTVPAHSTVFDDPTLGFAGTLPGPDFAEWCERVAAGLIAPEEPWARGLARETRPWSAPSRALYGVYLRWAFAEFARALPAGVRLETHRARAVEAERLGERGFRIALAADGGSGGGRSVTGRIEAGAVLLALGWLPRDPGDGHDLPAENPIDQGAERIRPGETVAVRGMGMGFTDLLSLLTEERGGRYEPDPVPGRPAALRYVPSGREPILIAGSRSGLPFLAKPEFGRVPPPARLDALTAAIPVLRQRRPIDFAREVWPLIVRDAAAEFDRVRRERGGATVAALDPDARGLGLDPALDPGDFEPERVLAPFAATGPAALDAEIAARISADATEAAHGMASPWKRALHVLQAARVVIVPLTEFAGITAESQPALRRYLTLAGLAGSGPPLFRVEQLLAAHRAGVVRFAGPGCRVLREGGRRVLHADSGLQVPVDRVADAFLPLPDAARLDDSLLRALQRRGLARTWAGAPDGAPATLEIRAADSALLGADGEAVPGLHSVGVLHEELRRFTIIAPIPRANSTVLREIDAAVGAALDRVLAAVPSSVSR